MLSSIHYLHRKGIVHRDLKLENFLFEGDSASSPLIMIDFGLSKHFDQHERMNQRVGSCYYTAPEVLSGDYDYRCDIWSLGVICYMLLSGSPPFYGYLFYSFFLLLYLYLFFLYTFDFHNYWHSDHNKTR